MFYHIMRGPSIPWCSYNCRLFSFRYYVTNFTISYQKQNVWNFITELGMTMKPVAFESYSFGIYLFKVNNRNTTTRCETCSKLRIETPERSPDLRHEKFNGNLRYVAAFIEKKVFIQWVTLYALNLVTSQLTFTYSKPSIKTLEKGVKYVQN